MNSPGKKNEHHPLSILLLEDDQLDADLIRLELEKLDSNLRFLHARNREEYLRALNKERNPDVVLSDYHLPQFNGLDALKEIRKRELEIPFIVVTGALDEETAVRCMKAGVDDYVLKERLIRLNSAIQSSLEKRRFERERQIAERALRASEARYKSIMEHSPDAILILDLEQGHFVEVNNRATAMLGYSRSELLEKSFLDISQRGQAGGQSADVLWRERQNEASNGYFLPFEWFLKFQNGNLIIGEVRITALSDLQDNLLRISIIDITHRKEMEEKLRRSEERYALAARAANDGLWDWDMNQDTMYLSDRLLELLGYGPEFDGNRLELWKNSILPADQDGVYQKMEDHFEGRTEQFQAEFRMVKKDTSRIWVVSRGLALLGPDRMPYRFVGSISDISDRKKAEEKLVYEAYHDPLTGLPNRSMFLEFLEEKLKQLSRRPDSADQGFAVMFLDLDRFKVINDSLGHYLGDKFLHQVAERLRSSLENDILLASLGSDEFVIFTDHFTDGRHPLELADSLHRCLRAPFYLAGQVIYTTASIGITFSDSNTYGEAEELLRDADIALHRAKELGRNRFEIFARDMHSSTLSFLQLETDLRLALAAEELEVYYQPQVEVRSNRVMGFEALIRWRHHSKGFIGPASFIPLAEETGLILEIGDYILETACRQMQEWHSLGFDDLKISVNCSARQFNQKDLSEKIGQILRDTRLDPSYLELELTESIVIGEEGQIIDTLQRLHNLGIDLAIDDFGTGYSSLAYLKKFPIDTLKIDQAFIRDVLTDPGDAAITTAIIGLARSLNLNVIAEGVETRSHLDFLEQNNCYQVQGYYFSPALPPAEAREFLEKFNAPSKVG